MKINKSNRSKKKVYPTKPINMRVKPSTTQDKTIQQHQSNEKKHDKSTENMKEKMKSTGASFQSGEMYLQDMITLSFLANSLRLLKDSFERDPKDSKKEMIDDLEKEINSSDKVEALTSYLSYRDAKADLLIIDEKLSTLPLSENNTLLLDAKAELVTKIGNLALSIPIGKDEESNLIYPKDEDELLGYLNKVESPSNKAYRTPIKDADLKDEIKIKDIKELLEMQIELRAKILEEGVDEETISSVIDLASKATEVVSKSPTIS